MDDIAQTHDGFHDVKARLEQIAEEVNSENISLDDALSLYEEAVKLGMAACDLSESDIFPEEIQDLKDAEGVGATDESESDKDVEFETSAGETEGEEVGHLNIEQDDVIVSMNDTEMPRSDE